MRVSAIASSALGALAPSLAVSANNLANANTNGFKASEVRLETGPGNVGVQISEIRKDARPGAYVPAPVYPTVGREQEQRLGWVESSNTDYAQEFVDMINVSQAYAANATVIRTADDLLGRLVDELA